MSGGANNGGTAHQQHGGTSQKLMKLHLRKRGDESGALDDGQLIFHLNDLPHVHLDDLVVLTSADDPRITITLKV